MIDYRIKWRTELSLVWCSPQALSSAAQVLIFSQFCKWPECLFCHHIFPAQTSSCPPLKLLSVSVQSLLAWSVSISQQASQTWAGLAVCVSLQAQIWPHDQISEQMWACFPYLSLRLLVHCQCSQAVSKVCADCYFVMILQARVVSLDQSGGVDVWVAPLILTNIVFPQSLSSLPYHAAEPWVSWRDH